MAKTSSILVIALMLLLPSDLLAVGMDSVVLEVAIPTRSVGNVIFSHAKHGTNCGECHPKIFQKKNPRRRAVTMVQMEKGRSCGTCHNGKRAFSVTERCATCHAGDIIYKNVDEGNVTFPHSSHLENFSCDECHPKLFIPDQRANKATMADMEKGKSCGACHNGDGAFNVAEDCESCHQS